jgi:mannose-6-phosphate isomerase-like protein (cupin superfamily)
MQQQRQLVVPDMQSALTISTSPSPSSNQMWKPQSLQTFLNLRAITLANVYYRTVVLTTPCQQVVLMYLPKDEYIDEELHQNNDQFFRVEMGHLLISLTTPAPAPTNKQQHDMAKGSTLSPSGKWIKQYNELNDGDSESVPCNVIHSVYALEDTHLYTIYSPPEHQPFKKNIVHPLPDDHADNEIESYLLSTGMDSTSAAKMMLEHYDIERKKHAKTALGTEFDRLYDKINMRQQEPSASVSDTSKVVLMNVGPYPHHHHHHARSGKKKWNKNKEKEKEKD